MSKCADFSTEDKPSYSFCISHVSLRSPNTSIGVFSLDLDSKVSKLTLVALANAEFRGRKHSPVQHYINVPELHDLVVPSSLWSSAWAEAFVALRLSDHPLHQASSSARSLHQSFFLILLFLFSLYCCPFLTGTATGGPTARPATALEL